MVGHALPEEGLPGVVERLHDRRIVQPDRLALRSRQLRNERFIFFKPGTGLRAVSERATERAGFAPRVSFETSSHNRLLALVNEGLGVAFVPASAVTDPPPRAVVVRPAAPAIDRTVGVVWRADHRHTPAASAFLVLLRQRASLED
jgi:LysR family transcriptional regulator, transcription activator of glutamate synthase operon